MSNFPKLRGYVQRRSRATLEKIWDYRGPTACYATADEAKAAFIHRNPNSKDKVFRVELAATHGYYIED